MIQFTRLRLSGFKSFVDPGELLIAPGMTGVVGPNGCGKSNLVEALRWVMGETSAKQMRGGEMDDVIFGGTSHRPPRRLAEVTISLDNSLRQAPALFNDFDELEITRRIERGEGSDYRCNGKPVRARDVHLLFADAATGARSTAMVSQGRVGALINARPAQRRSLLEEAAGIGGLYSRRQEAETRLKGAEGNLERVQDVLAALEVQIASLNRQARQARKYRELSQLIRTAEATLLYQRWAMALETLTAARQMVLSGESIVAAAGAEAAAAAARHSTCSLALPALREQGAAAAARLQRITLECEHLEAEGQRLAARQQQAEALLRQARDDIERESARDIDARETLELLAAEQEELLVAGEGADDMLVAALERAETLALQVEELDGRLTAHTGELARQRAVRQSRQRQYDEAGSRLQRARQREEEALKALEDVPEGDGEECAEAAGLAEQATWELEEARQEQEAAEDQLQQLRQQQQQQQQGLQQITLKVTRLQAEASALEALLKADGGPGGRGDERQGTPVLDLLEVSAGYEAAVAVALGQDGLATLNPADPCFWQEIGNQQQADDVARTETMLPGCRPLSSRVSTPPALQRWLSGVYLVADGEEGEVPDDESVAALASHLSAGEQLVSRQGGLWRWDGLVQKSAPRDDGGGAMAVRLRQKNRLAELQETLAEEEALLAEAGEAGQALEESCRQADSAVRHWRERCREAERQGESARRTLAAARQAAAAREQQRAAARAGAGMAATAVAEALAGVEDAAEALALLEDEDIVEADGEVMRQTLHRLRAELSVAREGVARVQRDADSRRSRLQQLESELAGWQQRLARGDDHRATLQERLEEAREQVENLAGRPFELAEQREALEEAREEAAMAHLQASEALALAERDEKEAESAQREAEQAFRQSREQYLRAESAVEQCELQLRQAAESISERLDCTPRQAGEMAGLDMVAADQPVPDMASLESTLQKATRERENMGPVNLRAEQELEELENQNRQLAAERDDLVAAIARLRQGIGEINKEGRQRLMASFELVDRHFRSLFTRLFGGGRAHLALTESEDPLNAGLEIYASPPGKRLQILSLLSGGEQAMTAIALLFAVFLVNPAPICVLDEVDAPLDDANVDRFCSLLGELTRLAAENGGVGTRFLVITHHRMTMARMDRLYGVTMAERGVSRLVSVDLQQAEILRDTVL